VEVVSDNALSQHLQDLNPQQLEAVRHRDGPILVLAGAGSGKTRVLTRRVAHLVLEHDVEPWRILAVTFTNKATEEMRNRLFQLLGDRARGLWISTFHSTGLRVLRRHAGKLGYAPEFTVYDEQDSKTAMKRLLREMEISEKECAPEACLRFIDRAKNACISPSEARRRAATTAEDLKAEIYERYQRSLLAANAMDFGDLLVNALRLFQQFPEQLQVYRDTLHYILVDEFQDTNTVQYRIVRLLAHPRNNLLVVGDDDQSIYSFRGATVENILQFENDFPAAKVVTLEQNYRSTHNILEVAQSVIAKNERRKSKSLWTAGEAGEPVACFVGYDESEEACFVADEIAKALHNGVPHGDIAVFYRTNAQSRALEEALADHRIPYCIYGGMKFYERKEVKDIMAYLRLLLNESDNQAFYESLTIRPAESERRQSRKSPTVPRKTIVLF
jgi:DNA helicase II / ATP-dependent DNA helicase PcrA